MTSLDGTAQTQLADEAMQHLGITSGLTQALFPPKDSQAFQAVKEVRDALDEVNQQIKRDFLHKQASRTGINVLARSYSSGSLLASPRSPRHMSPSPEPKEHIFSKPALDPLLQSNFMDFYQSRRASSNLPSRIVRDSSAVAEALGFPQPTRGAVAATGLALQERPQSPSALKQVLAQMQRVRAPVVALQSRCASAEALNSYPARSGRYGSSHRPARAGSIYDHNNINLQARLHSFQDFLGRRDELVTPLAAQSYRPWGGAQSPDRASSPQNQLVLRTLALHTPHNIVAPGCLSSPPEFLGRPGSASPGRFSSLYRSGLGSDQHVAAATSPTRFSSPLLGSLVQCSGCNQHHMLKQHHTCCHQCPNCCHCPTHGMQQQEPVAEASSSTCPCIQAYRKGRREYDRTAEPVDESTPWLTPPRRSAAAMMSSNAAETAAAAAQARAAAAGNAQQQAIAAAQVAAAGAQAVLAQLLSPGRLASAEAALAHAADDAQQQEMVAVKETAPGTHAAVATAAEAGEAGAAADVAHDDAAGGSDEGDQAAATDQLSELMLQLMDMQQQLMNEGPPFDAQTLEDLSDQLAQMVAWSEPRHEELLRQALAQQQELLAIQQRELLASQTGANPQPPALQLPPQVQRQQQQFDGNQLAPLLMSEQQGAGDVGSFQASIGADRTGSWVVEQRQQAQDSNQGPRETHAGSQAFGRAPAASTADAVSRLLGNATAFLPTDDRARVSQAATQGTYTHNDLGSASMGNRHFNKVSWVDNPVAQQDNEHALLGLLDLQEDNLEDFISSGQGSGSVRGLGTQQRRSLSFQQHQSTRSASSRSFGQQQLIPAPEDSEGILAAVQEAYDGAFAGSGQPVMRFMMAPNSSALGGPAGADWVGGGAVLHQGPPQVTDVAQMLNLTPEQAMYRPRSVSVPQSSSHPVSPGGQSMSASAWSGQASGMRAAGQRLSSPAAVAAFQQQDFDGPAANAADSAGLAMSEQQLQRQGIDAHQATAVTVTEQQGSPQYYEKFVSGRDSNSNLEQHLSRLSPVKGSQTRTVSDTPKGNRFAYSSSGVGNGMAGAADHLSPAASAVAFSAPGGLSSTSAHRSAAGGRGKVDNATTMQPELHAGWDSRASSTVDGVDPQSSRLSVRFLEAGPLEAAVGQHSYDLNMEVYNSVAGRADIAAAQQQTAETVQQLLQQQQYQEARRASAARAGSFEAPESSTSSAGASANQVGVVISAALGQMVASVPVQLQTAAAAAEAAVRQSANTDAFGIGSAHQLRPSSNSTAQLPRHSNSSPSVGASMRSLVPANGKANGGSRPSGMALGATVGPATSLPASNKSTFSNAGTAPVPEQQSSFGQQQQRTQQGLPPRQSVQQLAMQVRQLSSRFSSRSSRKSMVSATGDAALPAASSDWKQQQLKMQQQLQAQAQQLRQIQSLSNSTSSTPRSSVMASNLGAIRNSIPPVSQADTAAAADTRLSIASVAAGSRFTVDGNTHDIFKPSSVAGPTAAAASSSPGADQSAPFAVFRQSQWQIAADASHSTTFATSGQSQWQIAADASHSAPLAASQQSQRHIAADASHSAPLAAFRQSQWQIAADASRQQQASALTLQNGSAAQHVAQQLDAAAAPLELQEIPAGIEVTSISSSDPQRDTPDSLTSGTSGSEDVVNDAGAIMRDVLLQRFMRRHAGKVMQKTLSGWWRYTVARKAMAAVSARQCERASEGHSVVSIAADGAVAESLAGQCKQHQHLQSVSLTLKGLEDGLQRYLTAGDTPEDLQFALSGEVRLQHSPIKQRPSVKPTANSLKARDGANKRPPAKANGSAAADAAAAAAFAAYAKPLQEALGEIRGMVAAMENLCVGAASGKSSNRLRPSPGNPGNKFMAAAATDHTGYHGNSRGMLSANGVHACQQQQQHPAGLLERVRSPDKSQLRGQLRNVQGKLVRLEVKMCQAQSLSDDQSCSGAPKSGGSPPTRTSPPLRGHGASKQEGCVNGCGNVCKGGCVRRAGMQRRFLVGRMQDEIGQLQHELAELREMLPAAFA